jgi:hypothetical protein
MNKYYCHASGVGKIMANPRTKSEFLSKTAKTAVEEQFLYNEFGIKKDFSNRYTERGTNQEDESILFFSKVTGNFGVQKNEQKFKNDYFVGTPDIITEDSIIDIKTSWDATTFPWFDSELPNKDYMYQLLAYMDLTGKLNGYVAYCLINHTEDAIQDEIRRETWKLKAIDPTDEQALEIEQKVRDKMQFDRIPENLRVKVFEVEYDENTVNKMKERVEECREYYSMLESSISNLTK